MYVFILARELITSSNLAKCSQMGPLITVQSLPSQTLLDKNKTQILQRWNKEENSIEL